MISKQFIIKELFQLYFKINVNISLSLPYSDMVGLVLSQIYKKMHTFLQ